MARGVDSDPISTLAGRSAVYWKVQAISCPDSCKCVTQKTIQAAELDHNVLQESIPDTNLVLAGDAVGLDAEVLRIVLAKAHHPLLRNLVYPEV